MGEMKKSDNKIVFWILNIILVVAVTVIMVVVFSSPILNANEALINALATLLAIAGLFLKNALNEIGLGGGDLLERVLLLIGASIIIASVIRFHSEIPSWIGF